MNFILKAGLILSRAFSVPLEEIKGYLWGITLIDLCIENHSKVNLIMMDNLHFILLSVLISFISQLNFPPPSSSPIPSPCTLSHPLLLCSYSEKVRLPMGINKAWHINFGVLCSSPMLSLGKATQNEK